MRLTCTHGPAPVLVASGRELSVGPDTGVRAIQGGRERALHREVPLEHLLGHRRKGAAQVAAARSALPSACV